MIIYRDRLQSYYDFLVSRKNQIIDNIEFITHKFRNFNWDDKVYDLCRDELNKHIQTLNTLLVEIMSAEQLLKDTLEKFDEYYKFSDKELKKPN